MVRKVLPDGARYLGPFRSGGQAELLKAAIEDALPLRRCTAKIGARGGGSPSALLELRRCLGPCAGAVAPEVYGAVVARLEAALDDDSEPLLAPLRQRMAGYAAEQRYEQAAAARDRLEVLTRALAEARRIGALAGAEEIVVARPHPRGREVTVLRRGQLVSVTIVPADNALQPPTDVREHDLQPITGPPPRHLVDELRLVARWLDQVAGEVEVVAVSGTLASPAIGGAALQVRYDPGRQRRLVPGEARGRPMLRPLALPGFLSAPGRPG